VGWAADSIDPVLARLTVRPQENVTAQEVNDERNNVAQMSAGIEPAMPTKGINAQLRLQTLVETISQSPKLSQQYVTDPGFRALVDNRQKYLMQQLAQAQNKVIGYLGTAPMQSGAVAAA
jgi:hypothetical protein